MIHTRLLHYELVEKLGEGGMGVVYKAYDMHLDRFVAVKVLPPHRLEDASSRARFMQEAKAASALNHPNIIVVHDAGSFDGTDFIAMEYVSGTTLDHLIPKNGMRLKQALHIADQIADALASAHSAGIIHRDLKPSNVMVDHHGLVKVLDFGLAKVTRKTRSDDATTELATEVGTILGTAGYMSPEQVEGKPLDGRSDIFSFGAVLYEMLSGHHAFSGGSKVAIMASVINNSPERIEHIPPELERVINRCLRKDPARRFQHMDDVKVALDELREESDSGQLLTAATVPRKRGRGPLLLCAAVILAVAASLVWNFGVTFRDSGSAATVAPLTTYPGNEAFPSFSPDGAQLAFTWTGERGDNTDIYVKSIGSENPLRLTTDPRVELSPAWSPDGRYIAFLRQLDPLKVGCYLIPPTGGAERKLGELTGYVSTIFRAIAWLPDSRRLLVGVMAGASWHSAGLQGLRVLSMDSDNQEDWTRPDGPRGQDVSPSVSPDGRRIAFARVLDFDQSELFVMDVPDPGARPARPTRIVVLQRGATDPLWMRNGRELIFIAGLSGQPSCWRVQLSSPSEARRIGPAAIDVFEPALSWTASRLAYATRVLSRPDIWRIALSAPGVAGGRAEPLVASTHIDQNPTYSPDGSLIAFESSRSGSAEIWVADKDGRNPLQITALGSRPNTPVWSPNGRQIAFRCPYEGGDEVCVAGALGGAVRRLTEHPAQDRPETWSPDGKWIYFSSTRGGRRQTWRVGATGGESEFVGDERGGRLSADGTRRFLVDTATYWITAEPAGGGPSENLVGPLSMMGNWAVADRGIYYIPREVNRRYALMYYDIAVKAVHEVAQLAAPPQWGIAVSPDGRAVLITMSAANESGSDLMLVENFR